MDKARKPGPSRSKSTGVSHSKGKRPVGPNREVRVNRKALVLVGVVGISIVPALLGIKTLQEQSGRSNLLREAKKQRDVAKRPDLALGYFNRYLELAPDDVEALDQRAVLLSDSARDLASLGPAIQAHVILLSKSKSGPDQGPARKRLAELQLRAYQFRAAEETIRDYLQFREDDPEGHRLLARSLEGSGRLGDLKALEGAVAEYEVAENLQPGDVATAERLAVLYLDKFPTVPRRSGSSTPCSSTTRPRPRHGWRGLDSLPRSARFSPAPSRSRPPSGSNQTTSTPD